MGYNIIRQGKEKKNKIKSLEYFKGGVSDVLFRGIEPQTSCFAAHPIS